MMRTLVRWIVPALFLSVGVAECQQPNACAELSKMKIIGVEITKAAIVPAGSVAGPAGMPSYGGTAPVHCRVDGVINRRKGVDGKEYGIGFAIGLPENWNGDFVMQGGGGANGFISAPIGASVAGKTPALTRGFAVASTDTGHKSGGGSFDFGFMRDQQAMLDFAYLANARVAELAKGLLASYYGKPVAYSYFVGCSTGGREGMVLSQQYPTLFNGIVSGAPARRTGFSGLGMRWGAVNFNQIAPKDASGKPMIAQAFSDGDRKLFADALLKKCDARDGVTDGMISDPLGCDFDPAALTCQGEKNDSCLTAAQVGAIKRVFGGVKTSRGFPVYPGFLYDTGVTYKSPIPGLLAMGAPGPIGVTTTAMEMDVDKEVQNAAAPLVDPMSTNLTTFYGNGGKLIFYHGVSDPWFSALDTLEYFKRMADANGGLDKVAQWSQIYFVPGMGHCGGGAGALDEFDMLSAVVNWVEKGTAPESVTAMGKAFPGRSRPLCAYPKHAQYKGQGDPEDAKNWECR